MDIDTQSSLSNSLDDNHKKARHSPASALTVLISIAFIWISIFLVIVIAGPIHSIFTSIINSIAETLSVSPSSLLVGAAFAAYISIALILAQSSRFRDFAKKISNTILKSEKSFYVSGISELTGGTARKFASLEDRLKAIEQSTNNIQPIPDENLEEVKQKSIRSAIENLSEEISTGIRKNLSHERMQIIWGGSLSRLSDQIIVLGSRANLTLWMGIIFCTSGLFALWYSFFSAGSQNINLATPGMEWIELAKAYAPRLTLVVLIEVIGFFFLKMYRATLSEIRYVQNEITNIEMRALALNSAQIGSASTLESVIDVLAKTDRNSIIEKGQTTIEIEKQRASNEADKTAIEAAVSLIHGTEKSSIWRRS